MLRVPEHYAHFGARHFGHALPGADAAPTARPATAPASLQGLLRRTRKLVLWGAFGVPALMVMAVWQFVDPADGRYGQEQTLD